MATDFLADNRVITLGGIGFNTDKATTDGVLWYASLEGWDSPSPRVTTEDRPGGHGAFWSPGFHGSRPLTLTGITQAPDLAALEAAGNLLAQATDLVQELGTIAVTDSLDPEAGAIMTPGYTRGSRIPLTAEYRDVYGQLVDPTNPRVSIIDPAGTTVVDEIVPDRRSTGIYDYPGGGYLIPPDASSGTWRARWSGVINGAAVDDVYENFQVSGLAPAIEATSTLTEVLRNSPLRWRVLSCAPGSNAFAEFSIALLAPDSFRYSIQEYSGITNLAAVTSGVTAPVIAPVSAGGGQSSLISAVNGGTTDAPVVLEVRGPVTNPVVSHDESGAAIRFALTLNADDVLVLDSDAMSITMGGESRRYAAIGRVQWFQLRPGANTIRFSAGSADPAASLTARWRHAYV